MLIKDLSASTELDQAAMTAVRGGANGNADVSGIFQGQQFLTANTVLAGPGSAVNNFVTVDGSQDADEDTDQNIGDKFSLALGFVRGIGILG